ncbi:hypothetical protein KC366_g7 [Hortaea werneckii]|nr:hypothetical protein KC366_g7 [Hortaea werneckii]
MPTGIRPTLATLDRSVVLFRWVTLNSVGCRSIGVRGRVSVRWRDTSALGGPGMLPCGNPGNLFDFNQTVFRLVGPKKSETTEGAAAGSGDQNRCRETSQIGRLMRRVQEEAAWMAKSRLNKSGTALENDSTNNHGRKYNDGDNDIEGDGGRSGTGGHKVVRNDGPVGRFSWAGVRKSQRGDLQSRAP